MSENSPLIESSNKSNPLVHFSMAKKKKWTTEDASANAYLTDYAFWMLERFERMNEQLMARAATFLGFIGVEIALIGQITIKDFKINQTLGAVLCAMAVFFLLVALYFFILVLKPLDFHIPDERVIFEVFEKKVKKKMIRPLEHLIDYPTGRDGWFSALDEENKQRSERFGHALKLSLFAQVIVAIYIISRWF